MTELLLDLTQRYCEAHRAYHDLRHVATMLVQGRAFPLSEVQVWAVWFHDAIYDPLRSDNEEQSARLAERMLPEIGMPAPEVARVALIVRDTIAHRPSSQEAEAVLDLDLASLAASPEQFWANRRAIRSEYRHVSDADFATGTRLFAERMLKRERLFLTPWGAEREDAARRNLRELQQWQDGENGA
jgi:predicted metal-dependent HD superfamily phosphohydrolase